MFFVDFYESSDNLFTHELFVGEHSFEGEIKGSCKGVEKSEKRYVVGDGPVNVVLAFFGEVVSGASVDGGESGVLI